MTSWRVATYNIRHGLGPDGRVDLARTVRDIQGLGADVLGLQEVDVGFGPRSDHEDQAARLGELLGMQVAFGAALDLPPTGASDMRRRYGVALLTHHEVLAQETQLLPPHPGYGPPTEPRGALRAHLRRRDGAEIDVLVTHLDNASRAHRTAQVQGIVDLTRETDGPAVLMGDMNADPTAPELAALPATGWREAAEQVRTAAAAARRPTAHDLPAAASRLPAPVSLLRAAPALLRRAARPLLDATGLRRGSVARATHPARFPLRRIDVVWVRGAVTATSFETGPRGSSDHRPVVVGIRTGP